MNQLIQPETIAPLFARVLLGALFLFQGYDKVFGIRVKGVIETIEPAYQRVRMPRFLIVLMAYFTSYVELAGGLCLILGIFKYYFLYLLGIDLIIVSIGMSLLDPVWKMDLVFPRFVLLIFLLVYPAYYDAFTLQYLLDYFGK